MSHNMYSVFDNKALAFNLPFVFSHDGEAVRAFTDIANDVGTTVGRHPADFCLYCIGTFEAATGALTRVEPYRNLGLATAYLRAPSVSSRPSLPLTLPDYSDTGMPGAAVLEPGRAPKGNDRSYHPSEV